MRCREWVGVLLSIRGRLFDEVVSYPAEVLFTGAGFRYLTTGCNARKISSV